MEGHFLGSGGHDFKWATAVSRDASEPEIPDGERNFIAIE